VRWSDVRRDRPSNTETVRDDEPVTVPHPLPGDLIDHVYRIERHLGGGGYGVVMLAHDELLDRPVALKFIYPSLTEHDASRRRFLNEARAMARIRHPNVVVVHNIGRWEDTPYLVMEYLAGPTLLEYFLDRSYQLALDDALGLFDQMCAGVAAIHAAGATHNDLKPSNMIIGAASRLAIADFGLAEWVRDRSFRKGGTVGFIAPEVIRDEEVAGPLRTAADVYSLGVLACILFTGSMPFVADTAEQLLEHQLGRKLRLPSQLRPQLPDDFDQTIWQALSPDPRERPKTVELLLAACTRSLSTAQSKPVATRILVIEDDVVMHPLLRAMLMAIVPDATTMCFASPVAALADADLMPPHLVITDLNMPEVDGFGVVRALRSRPHTQHIPIVAITGSATSSDWERLTTLGADGFLVKPFSTQTLRAVVRRMLTRVSAAP